MYNLITVNYKWHHFSECFVTNRGVTYLQEHLENLWQIFIN